MLVVVCFVFFVFCVVFEQPFSYRHGRKLILAKENGRHLCNHNIKRTILKHIFVHPQSNNKIAKSNPKQKSISKSLDL